MASNAMKAWGIRWDWSESMRRSIRLFSDRGLEEVIFCVSLLLGLGVLGQFSTDQIGSSARTIQCRVADLPKTWSRNWSPTPPNSAELLVRDSLYQARFGSIEGFRRDS